jgi:hypothetical protein
MFAVVGITAAATWLGARGSADRIPGGRAAGHGPSDFDPVQVGIGTRVEMQHTGDARVARQIATDHLMEDGAYYTKLARMQAGPRKSGLRRARG